MVRIKSGITLTKGIPDTREIRPVIAFDTTGKRKIRYSRFTGKQGQKLRGSEVTAKDRRRVHRRLDKLYFGEKATRAQHKIKRSYNRRMKDNSIKQINVSYYVYTMKDIKEIKKRDDWKQWFYPEEHNGEWIFKYKLKRPVWSYKGTDGKRVYNKDEFPTRAHWKTTNEEYKRQILGQREMKKKFTLEGKLKRKRKVDTPKEKKRYKPLIGIAPPPINTDLPDVMPTSNRSRSPSPVGSPIFASDTPPLPPVEIPLPTVESNKVRVVDDLVSETPKKTRPSRSSTSTKKATTRKPTEKQIEKQAMKEDRRRINNERIQQVIAKQPTNKKTPDLHPSMHGRNKNAIAEVNKAKAQQAEYADLIAKGHSPEDAYKKAFGTKTRISGNPSTKKN